MLSTLPSYSGDPIFSLVEHFKRDTRADKVNRSVGLYYDDKGVVPILKCVKDAERRYLATRGSLTYLPIEGDRHYRDATRTLLFGNDASVTERVSVVQTVGGSGALKIGADFLRKFSPDSKVWLSNPTWDNHVGVFSGAGIEVSRYSYYDARLKGLDFDGMLRDLESARPGDIVLLAPCCHNPTGIDPTRNQWLSIVEVIQRRGLIPFVDIAYQGFADDVVSDAWLIGELAAREVELLVSCSFSKNFSLYGERCGALCVCGARKDDSAMCWGSFNFASGKITPAPPTHGMAIVSTILSDEKLRAQWLTELRAMRDRIRDMRTRFHASLKMRAPSIDNSFLQHQIGMFAYTGLSPAQIDSLQRDYAVYALGSGRICIAGLNLSNVEYTAQAVADVMTRESNHRQEDG